MNNDKPLQAPCNFESELQGLLPPDCFNFDPAADRLLDFIAFAGPQVGGTSGGIVASSVWTPEDGVEFTFDVIDGHFYTLAEVKEFTGALLNVIRRIEGIDPYGDGNTAKAA